MPECNSQKSPPPGCGVLGLPQKPKLLQTFCKLHYNYTKLTVLASPLKQKLMKPKLNAKRLYLVFRKDIQTSVKLYAITANMLLPFRLRRKTKLMKLN